MNKHDVAPEPRTPEPPSTNPLLDVSDRSAPLRERVARWLWGYDIFISYSWADGAEIASDLERVLRDARFHVFRDRARLHIGDRLARTISQAIRRSSCLVIIATTAAIGARWVVDEVALADHLGRTIIPIACGDVLDVVGAIHPIFRERLRIERTRAPFVDQELVSAIAGSVGALRQARKRFALVSGVLGLVAVLAVAAAISFWVARQRRDEALHAQRVSEAERVALASSVARLDERPVEALLLAVEAVRMSSRPVPQPVETSLRDALAGIGGEGAKAFDSPVRHIWEVGKGVIAASSAHALGAWQMLSHPHKISGDDRNLLLMSDDEQDTVPVFVGGDRELRTWTEDGRSRALPAMRGFDPGGAFAARVCGIAQGDHDGTRPTLWMFDGTIAVSPVAGMVASLSPSCRAMEVVAGDQVFVLSAEGDKLVVRARLSMHRDRAAWSSDGKWLATSSGGNVFVISMSTGAVSRLHALPSSDRSFHRAFHRLAFSTAMTSLVAIDQHGTIMLWRDLRDGHADAEQIPALADYGRNGNALETTLEFSHDGRWLFASDSMREAVVIDLQARNHALAHPLFRLDQNGLATLPALRSPFTFTRDSQVLFVVDDRDVIDVWSLATVPIRITQLHGHDGGFTALCLLSDGTLVTGGLDGTLRRWPAPPAPVSGHWDVSRARWRASPIELRGDRWASVDGTSSMHATVGPDDRVIARGTEFPLRETSLLTDGAIDAWRPCRRPLRAAMVRGS